ncbi:LysR substrate-binding domain-containing protein [Pelagibacterium xiamenense]|uniref:LysR substrate-binding domain-containing protein n=1 Tax=Pelagibacterium xiamenense TaxID=2901140 RepID=UPI001E4C8CCC|nr:LysR substrate-binding domain-containing protein [Pelagibacterium xiamenense]MCD7058754.1 LysR substrate-binding domain-containing protein [Pelagibacterium xiamenense]
MNDNLPIPLNALRAIEAVARLGGLGPAAEALGVTPGAVSQHIRRAEERAGVVLFERTAHGLVPGAALAAILPELKSGFDALKSASARLVADEGHVLNVTLGNVSASRWLVWRLSEFHAVHPDIEVRLYPTEALVDLSRPDVDCGIRFGKGTWPDVDATLLARARVFPVCAPALAEKLKTPADLARVPVIRDRMTMLSWDEWLAAAGVPEIALEGPVYLDPALSFYAATAGQGVLLAVDIMVDYALAHSELVRPFAQSVVSEHGYWFATEKGKPLPSRTRKFRAWLLDEMSRASLE